MDWNSDVARFEIIPVGGVVIFCFRVVILKQKLTTDLVTSMSPITLIKY